MASFQEILIATVSGIIQGATELLPVSSSGHVLVFSRASGLNLSMSEVGILHLGTLVSILITFRDQLKHLKDRTLIWKILIAIIPAGTIGFLFNDFIDEKLGNPAVIVASLIFWGVVMVLIDIFKARIPNPANQYSKITKVTFRQSIIISIGQAISLVPGTSRSGVTTIFGILSGLTPDTAVNFSFISGIPLIAAAGVYGTLKYFRNVGEQSTSLQLLLLATALALITGLLAAYLFRRNINKRILTICGIYRVFLGIILLLAGLT